MWIPLFDDFSQSHSLGQWTNLRTLQFMDIVLSSLCSWQTKPASLPQWHWMIIYWLVQWDTNVLTIIDFSGCIRQLHEMCLVNDEDCIMEILEMIFIRFMLLWHLNGWISQYISLVYQEKYYVTIYRCHDFCLLFCI